MIPAYCINLESRPDRWAYMVDLSETAGFELIRVDAVDAKNPIHDETLSQMTSKGPTGIVGRGALACTQSHVKAWQAFLDTNERAAVFLEDDVVLSDDFVSVVEHVAGENTGFDLIKLECGGSAPDGLVVGMPLIEIGRRSLRPCFQIATDAAGYMLTRAGATQALARISQCDVGVDHYLFYPRPRRGGAGLAFAIVSPSVVIQDRSIGSNIQASRYEDSKLTRMLRRTFYEVAPVPFMLWKLLTGARIKKILFER